MRSALTAATATLLSATAPLSQAGRLGGSSIPWQIDTALYAYKESAGRVSATEPMLSAHRTDAYDRTVSIHGSFDAVSGASPTGAVPDPLHPTIPMDPNFKDHRISLGAGYDRPWGRDRRLSWGAGFSTEGDFTSFSGNAAVSRDLNDKNTTLSAGFGLEIDAINPNGGAPVPMLSPNAQQATVVCTTAPSTGKITCSSGVGSKNRTVLSGLLGVTQVVTRRWLSQFNLTVEHGSGYYNDPYKVVSIVTTSGVPSSDTYIAEGRPDARTRTGLFWQHKIHPFSQDVIDVSYRWYRDSWGITSGTWDLKYRFEIGDNFYVEPHWRRYQQSAADFYRPWLLEGTDYNSSTHQAAMAYASADSRLGEFSARTIGIKVAAALDRGEELSLRFETYQQTHTQPASAPGWLGITQLVPDLKAALLTIGYSFQY
jgi:hypothetical protein